MPLHTSQNTADSLAPTTPSWVMYSLLMKDGLGKRGILLADRFGK